MEIKDRALQNTEYVGMYWGLVYVSTAASFLRRTENVWTIVHTHPFVWWGVVVIVLELFYCLLPLFLGLAFRKILKKEKDRELLSARTYEICDFRIAQLLLFVYVGMMLFPMGK